MRRGSDKEHLVLRAALPLAFLCSAGLSACRSQAAADAPVLERPSDAPSEPRASEPTVVPSSTGFSQQAALVLKATDLPVQLPTFVAQDELAATSLSEAAGDTSQQGIWLYLDEQSPRPLVATGGKLARLVDELEELAPGVHRLVALRLTAAAVEFEVLHFSYETRSALPDSSVESQPPCLLLTPQGTYSGEALLAAGLTEAPAPWTSGLRFLALSPGRVRFELVAESLDRILEVAQGTPALFSADFSGDARVRATCLGPDGAEKGRSERTVTLNPELEPQP